MNPLFPLDLDDRIHLEFNDPNKLSEGNFGIYADNVNAFSTMWKSMIYKILKFCRDFEKNTYLSTFKRRIVLI